MEQPNLTRETRKPGQEADYKNRWHRHPVDARSAASYDHTRTHRVGKGYQRNFYE